MNDKQVLLLMLAKAKASFNVREYPGEEDGSSGIEFRSRNNDVLVDFYFDVNGNLTRVWREDDIKETLR